MALAKPDQRSFVSSVETGRCAEQLPSSTSRTLPNPQAPDADAFVPLTLGWIPHDVACRARSTQADRARRTPALR